MPDATFATPDLTTFWRLDELGLEFVGQHLEADRAVLARAGSSTRTPLRGGVGVAVARAPLGTASLGGWRTSRWVGARRRCWSVRRYKCGGCGHVWRQDTSRAAEPRAKLSRTALRWALVGLVCQHLTVARLAEALAVSWTTANDAVLAEGRRVLIDGCVLNADRGSQFRSRPYVAALHRHRLRGSMGPVASSADNAAMESFFALLQKNILNRHRWDSRDQLRLAVVTWIERTYHRRRRQRGLGPAHPDRV